MFFHPMGMGGAPGPLSPGPEGHSCAQPASGVLHVFSIQSRDALLIVAWALCGFARLCGKGAFS